MNKLEIFLLRETLGVVSENWNLHQYVNFHYSDIMKSLYLTDFPEAWENKELRKRIATIGANDYFNKWNSEEFMILESEEFDEIFQLTDKHLANGSIINGKRTGIPLVGGNHQLLFYNKNYVNEKPETMEELICTSEKIKKEFNLEYGFVFPTGLSYFILPFLYGYGADLWSSNSEAIPRLALYKTICLLKELIYDKSILPIKWEQTESNECFIQGKAAFCIGGDWNISGFDKATGHNLGICEIPKLNRECRSTANASYLFISKFITKDLYYNIKEFCKKFLSEEIQTKVINELYRMPAAREYVFNEYDFDELLTSSYKVYKKAFILPPKKEITHMYHVLADLLEPNVLISDTSENLTDKVLLHLKDVDSYYTNNLLKL
ncbi:extracellular solute-binding protein [Anaerosacchariphilus polymeriproducens]|uniref:Extracellular solute-binding protein n=1 Tax=Anaerosacchariphilus polymeriproducens TaxID=1812858 RepID=A0A371ASF5_9FIRM|nr:extracellular solute-binding protein [Anaerosacchariphilus polymeriproducens]RDU22506.1 extracellular solute-binding protein [Anaerosacchariphilus polymeriproducens]